MATEQDADAYQGDEEWDDLTTSDSGGGTESLEDERDEVKEIRDMSKPETIRVRNSRIAATFALLLTAVAITWTTYWLLDKEETSKFETAYNQFARTVADAAIEQQKDARDAIHGLAQAVSIAAQLSNATWPYFAMTQFEALAQDFKALSRAELAGINNIVTRDERGDFEEFARNNYQSWIKRGHELAHGNFDMLDTNPAAFNDFVSRKGDKGFESDMQRDVYYVRTTLSPPPRRYGPATNWNLGSVPSISNAHQALTVLRNEPVFGPVRPFQALPEDEHRGLHSDDKADNPHSFMFYPIFENTMDYNSEMVATVTAAMAWDASMRFLLPDNVKGIFAVVYNNCNQSYSYELEGQEAFYRGDSDLHAKKYDNMKVDVNLALHTNPLFTSTPGHCQYRMSIYPSKRFEQDYITNTPEIVAVVVAVTFFLVAVFFFVYDTMVQRRNEKLIISAAKSNAIVSSLFPGAIRDKLLGKGGSQHQIGVNNASATNLKSFLGNSNHGSDDGEGGADLHAKPLAEFFLETTVMFADIVGFTAWSSVREPSQVFTLLEGVYCAFDLLARRRRIFKVETVGDCYVAVAGVPEYRPDHALMMVRFARDCLMRMRSVTKDLELRLGPGTADLSLRIGIHSGAVTAGVLRGDRSRFQLFGDTMNTTARIESTSERGRIQLSKSTAELLINAGKEGWLTKREDKIIAKGKGDLETYWLKGLGMHMDAASASGGASSSPDLSECNWANAETDPVSSKEDRESRLVNWNVEVLLDLLKEIVARRKDDSEALLASKTPSVTIPQSGDMPLEEFKEIIELPAYDRKKANKKRDINDVVIPKVVSTQLQDLVFCISSMYQSNPFHNFDHASHVVMSMTKLLTRIVAPSDILDETAKETGSETGSRASGGTSTAAKKQKDLNAMLHDHTYGITSDQLTQFACAFSALIHDVDHRGVPNPQLIKEKPDLGAVYKGRSVAEQNSFNLSWDLLMDDRYSEFRRFLCPTKEELSRFRQLVINCVMATDLGDKQLKELRNARWEKAFAASGPEQAAAPICEIQTKVEARAAINRKATIVIEHLIQASDVAHTMQHWHVYRKWNENLFEEMYMAFRNGRAETNPADFWYKGEMGFFDFYIIPLTKKLKDCGVFGISSDEFLNYALRNREEWEARGEEVVAEMLEKLDNRLAGISSW